jgi:hypothetical protein
MTERLESTRYMLNRQLKSIREHAYSQRQARDRILTSLLSKYDYRDREEAEVEPSRELMDRVRRNIKLPKIPVLRRRFNRGNPYNQLHEKLTHPMVSEEYQSLVEEDGPPENAGQVARKFKSCLMDQEIDYYRLLSQTKRFS